MFQTPINPMAAQFGVYSQPQMVNAGPYQAPQTAAAPAQSTFTVGDAAKKKRIAEALRGKVSQDYEQMAPTGHVEGSGAFPGQSYINWGSILSNAAQPWLEAGREEKALAAEDEAAAARMETLMKITGESTGADLVRIGSELGDDGITSMGIEKMMPKEEKMANFLQALPNLTEDSAAMLAPRFGMTEEEGRTMARGVIEQRKITSDEELGLFETKERIKARYNQSQDGYKPTAEEVKFNLWQGANPDKDYNDYLAAVAGGDKTSATELKRMYAIDDKLTTATNSLDRISNLQDIISDPESTLFSTPQKAAGALNRFGEALGGGAGSVLQSVAAGLIDPDAMITKKEAIRLATQDLQMVGGNDSNYELQKMLEQYPDNAMSQESALALINGLYRVTAITRRALELESEANRNGTYGKAGGVPKGGFWQAAKREMDGEVENPLQDITPTQVGGSDDDLLNKYAPK